jgi:hypothetical protein
LVAGAASLGGFVRVTSGVLPGVPRGAAAVAPTLTDGEDVVCGWDGSFGQDGGVLVLVTTERMIFRSDDVARTIALLDVTGIVVDEDEGRRDRGADGLGQRALGAGARAQRAVQARKQVPADT